MTLSTEQQILIEQRVTNEAKSIVVAYLLWACLGWFGAHRFYLDKTGSAVAMLVLSLFSFVTMAIVIGIFTFAVVAIWVVVDAFLIPGMINSERSKLRDQLTSNASITNAAVQNTAAV
ncbi:TM2 domain-containing protein [Sulfitobacter delicatus]|jgi:TM2 domain-containing membrane protein YozV|uniref:TM2 domain-containing membrane protein YozV n=1 Tax=Sulfitobacter delicatus TaxID=218672 RepID=A0A1G7XVV6_9RHOB|nr:TM2 domain-containing protein [Sulfitobacter delicatus]SDG87880.1 TM2 domain-containing membrane protein YozV [Sulfitobacter delicatus]